MRYFLASLMIITSTMVNAHAPVINDGSNEMTIENPFEIENPEHSKAVFAELTGKPHYYRITSEAEFKFYAGLTAPKLDGCDLKQTFNLRVLDGNLNQIDKRDGRSAEWWPWYEEYGKTWYWVGPEIGKDFLGDRNYDAGVYYIEISNQTTSGKYVLAVGDEEKFGFGTIAGIFLNGTMGKIKSGWWASDDCN